MVKEIKVSNVTIKQDQWKKDYLLIDTEEGERYSRRTSGKYAAPGPELAIGGIYNIEYSINGQYKSVTKVFEGNAPQAEKSNTMDKNTSIELQTIIKGVCEIVAHTWTGDHNADKQADAVVNMTRRIYAGLFVPEPKEEEPPF